MSAAVKITRTDHSAAELRGLAGKTQDAEQTRRLLAIALVKEDVSRAQAAQYTGMDRQTLRDWVHRYNEFGVDGLLSRKSPGAPPKLTPEQMQALRALTLASPDPEQDEVVRWRCCDLQDKIAERFDVEVCERTVGKWLHKLKLTRLQARPYHPKKDPEAEAAFKKNFSSFLKELLLGQSAQRPVEIWFQDEARVGQKGTQGYVWAEIGSCPLMVRDNRHDSAYIFGALCPARGVGAAMITPSANTEAMNLHLAEISTQVAEGALAVILCDGAGWHKSTELVLPDNITLMPIPPYTPELNSMENIWEYLRPNKLCARVWKDYDAIVQACKCAWNWFIEQPNRIRSIGTREWATVNL